MTNTQLLVDLITESGYKRSYIAKAIGLNSAYSLARKINNESEFKASEINALCELLNISSLEKRQEIFFCKLSRF